MPVMAISVRNEAEDSVTKPIWPMTDATGTTIWGYDEVKRLISEGGPFAANDTVT